MSTEHTTYPALPTGESPPFAGFGLERPGVVDWSAGIAGIDPTVAA
jgi:hypothetical protein